MAFTEFTEQKKAKFLKALNKIPNVSRACRLAGISRVTAYNHRRADADFAAEWDEALEVGIEALEERAWEQARKGDTTMTIFLLKAHRPEKYREGMEHQHSGVIRIEYVDDWRDDTPA